MAAEVGSLLVTVGGDVTSLETGMAKGARAVKSFSSSAATQLRSVTNQAVKMGAAAVAAGAAMTTAIYVKQSKVIDSLAKTADSINVTTQALQAMTHISELNGVSSENMEKNLSKMQKTIGQASRQGGVLAETFSDIGVNIDDIVKMKPDEQLEVLAGAIGGVGDHARKTSIATDIFGRSGQAMLKVLEQVQKDGIKPTIDLLDSYGIAISRVDAAQVEAANDAIFESKKIIEGLGNTVTVELAPYVKEVADRFKAAALESGGFGDEVENAIRKSIHFAGQLADVLHGLRGAFKGVEVIAVGFGAAVVTVFETALSGVVKFGDSAISVSNEVIEALNKIPNVDIAKIDTLSNSEFMVGLRNVANEARSSVGAVRAEFNSLALEAPPSAAVEDFLGSVKDSSVKMAEEVADARDKMINPEKGDDNKTPEEKYAIEEQALRDHLSTMYGIKADSFKGIEGLTQKHWGVATSSTAGAMKNVLGTMSTGSRKAFEISKAWAIADAVISTAQGIAAGVRLGWPMGIPAVAWATATGMSQIQQIKSQKYGGGGTVAAAPASAPASSSAATSGQGQSGGGSQQTLIFKAVDPMAMFGGDQMNALAEKLVDFTNDGGKISVLSA